MGWPAREDIEVDRYLSRRPLLALALLFVAASCGDSTQTDVVMSTRDFEFTSSGKRISGILDLPTQETRAIVVLIHGTGMTDVRGDNLFVRLRKTFAEIGIASVVWDKPGQGRSEGKFDDNQPLESSAQEVIDAVAELRARKVPGAQHIGLWSLSRGGWVAPLALKQDPQIRFWISVGGPPAEDNKHYLMESNLPLEGRTPAQTGELMREWRDGRRLFFSGADYDTYLAATENLRKDPSVTYFAGDLTGTRELYAADQAAFLRAKDFIEIDERTTSIVNVQGFDQILKGLEIDVLAIFGELDTNVDWRRTRALYESTIGRAPGASLLVRTFPGCNHLIYPSLTGWVREVQAAPPGGGAECAGFYETQIEWLRQRVLGVRDGTAHDSKR